jgi:hypothetical protein
VSSPPHTHTCTTAICVWSTNQTLSMSCPYLRASSGLAAAAKNKDRPLLDEKMTKQDEREAKCLARAKSCEAMDRCLNYSTPPRVLFCCCAHAPRQPQAWRTLPLTCRSPPCPAWVVSALLLCAEKCGDKCAYKTMQSGGKKCPELPTAWEVISTDPDLKYISNIISMYGLAPAFNTTLTSTLLLPTNEVCCTPG